MLMYPPQLGHPNIENTGACADADLTSSPTLHDRSSWTTALLASSERSTFYTPVGPMDQRTNGLSNGDAFSLLKKINCECIALLPEARKLYNSEYM